MKASNSVGCIDNNRTCRPRGVDRLGQPEDIGSLMATLILLQSRWANAQRIEASGGVFP